jgi:hypothetical protein
MDILLWPPLICVASVEAADHDEPPPKYAMIQHTAPARPSTLLELLAFALTTDCFGTKKVLTSAWGRRGITNASLAVISVGQHYYYTT